MNNFDKMKLDYESLRADYEKAYVRMKELEKGVVIDDAEVERYIMRTPKVKDRIVDEYVKELNQTLPPTIMPDVGVSAEGMEERPTSIKEAGEMAIKLIKG